MTDNPKPSPIKAGDVLLIVCHPDDWAPVQFRVNRVGRKWLSGEAGLLRSERRWRINIHTMQVDTSNGVHGPADFVVLRSWEEWDVGKKSRAARHTANAAWISLRTDMGGRCPGGATAENIQAARVLLGLSDQASHDRADA